jgi:hypothetical protein
MQGDSPTIGRGVPKSASIPLYIEWVFINNLSTSFFTIIQYCYIARPENNNTISKTLCITEEEKAIAYLIDTDD